MYGSMLLSVLILALLAYFKLKKKKVHFFPFFFSEALFLYSFLAAWQPRECHNVTDCLSDTTA